MVTTCTRKGKLGLRRRTWVLLILNGVLFSFGCTPNTLSMFMMPFTDDKEPPEAPIITSKKEVTVVVMASAGERVNNPRGLPQPDNDVADVVGEHMRLRCQANKQKIKVIPGPQVRSYLSKQGASDALAPPDVGRHFKADYVVYLDVQAISLYEKQTRPLLYRGNAEIEVSLYDLHKKPEEGEPYKVYDKPYRCEYPGNGPRDTSDCSQTQFRAQFLARIGREVSKMFIAYKSDERMEME